MKIVLFCKKPYSFSILRPLHIEAEKAGDEVLWYVESDILDIFPFIEDSSVSSSIQELSGFKADAIFVPGNEVPYFLRGVKVQIFHGLAGEKKGHFRIRNYFDLYLTPGTYFTQRFNKLATKHGNFEVIETGWSKLDSLFLQKNDYNKEKQALIEKHNVKKIILFAPTFSPSLTCAEYLYDEILTLSQNPDFLVLLKFHDKMNKDIMDKYHQASQSLKNLTIVNNPNISKYLILSDIMISDTSSVVYEFLLLDKPVITFKSSSKNIKWLDIDNPNTLKQSVKDVLEYDISKNDRKWIIDNYHPYSDGQSAKRMIEVVREWLSRNPVPEKRKLPLLRRWKISKKYNKIKKK